MQKEKIPKGDTWIPYKLSELAIQNCLTICTSLLSRHKKAVFVSNYNWRMKNRSTMIILKIVNRSRSIINAKHNILGSKFVVHLERNERHRVL